jgi:hypothetical protein
MKRFLLSLFVLFVTIGAWAQYSLTSSPYSQDFNGLGTTTSSPAGGDLNNVSATLNGWFFSESGVNADNTITAGTGSSNTGDTYNFGSAFAADRTLGGLQSGNLIPIIGFYVQNNLGTTITSLTISYTGEQWRLGALGRVDQLDFQLSLDATSLTTGNWIDVNSLDFTAPQTGASIGALDGNLAANRTSISFTLTGLVITNGSTFFIRWKDFNASGADDGLGVDDLTMTAGSAASSTDYFRSVATGSWDDIATWESSTDNSTWLPATAVPNSAANIISIRNGHTVTFSAFHSVDQVVIENLGVLDFSAGLLNVENGSGDDIDVQTGGIFILSSAANPPSFAAGATCNVASAATLRVSAGGLTAAAPAAGVNASNFVYKNQSVLEYTLILAFSTDNVTYFPNVDAVTIPIFRTTQNMGSLGSNNNTIWNGIFEANGTVTFINTGTKTFRNGIRGSGNIDGTLSGKFIINGATAELGGSGSLTVPTTGGLEIGSPTTVTLSSNKTITGNISLLTDTYVVLGNNNLTVSGTVSNATITSYVKTNSTGKLILNNVGSGVSGKLFPIGLTSINPLFISSSTTADYSARIVEPITPPVFNNAEAVLRTWYITSSVIAPGATISFGYSYPGDCGGFYNNSGPVEAGVNVSGVWNIHQTGLTPAAFALVPGTYIVTPTIPINYFNNPANEFPFVVANNGAILPIDCIISIRAQKRNNTGIISWTVNSCSEVRSFEVQRSINNSGFQTIGTVYPVVNQTDFSFTDAALASGTDLYRIKVNGITGSLKYSNTVAIIFNSNDILISTIAPNPVHNSAMLTVSSGRPSMVDFKVYDMSGKLVKQWNSNIAEGNNTIELKVTELPAGMYTLFAATADAKTVSRFVKQ